MKPRGATSRPLVTSSATNTHGAMAAPRPAAAASRACEKWSKLRSTSAAGSGRLADLAQLLQAWGQVRVCRRGSASSRLASPSRLAHRAGETTGP
jgi:hypothetical protein